MRGGGVVVCLWLLWLAVTTSIANVTMLTDPAGAVRWAPHNGAALAALSDHLLTPDAAADTVERARRLAQAALVRDPTTVLAARTLGLIADARGRPDQAKRLFAYAEGLTRRDLATQLWLIESQVRADNVSGALRHFDTALRVSRHGPSILFPVLVAATDDATLLPALAGTLARNPAWRDGYLREVIRSGPSPRALVVLAGLLRAAGSPIDDSQTNALLARLVGDQQFGLARVAYTDAKGRQRAPDAGLVIDGGFQSQPAFQPFDWFLADTPDIYAVRELRDGSNGNFALVFHAERDRNGRAAQQLLMLPPGRYQFSALAGDIQADRLALPAWQISCAGKTQSPLMQLRLPAAGAPESEVADSFEVPSRDCPAQWLRLQLRASDAIDGVSGWVDEVTIRPRHAGD